jgi:non-specific serine/threonine protein kinase/serine/threonine-protein kinase
MSRPSDPSDPPDTGRPLDDLRADSDAWARVHDLFHEALKLDHDARVQLLLTVASRDPALADEVGSLLAAHEEAGGFLEETPAVPSGSAMAAGDRLGPYRIIAEIGRGGMGVVYRAIRDDESFTKEVAIKRIDPGMRSDEIMRRFRAERQILAMLDHPHIARLIDGGTAPDGSPYLVMDYVSGKSLLEYCDEHRLGVDQRIALFLKVCDAVQFAHQRLVVHRDLKSDNVLVTEDGSPRLLDFGIAKLLAPDFDRAAVTLTEPMKRMMTLEYASPEQIRGEPAAVSGDVYSLGVILYELLTGSRPLKFPTRTPEEVARVSAQVDPAPPSTAVARSPGGEAAERRSDTTDRVRRRLSGDLDAVILKALEKDPERRYGSVDQFAQDIRRHLDGLPVSARRPSRAYRLSRFVRRNRAAVLTAMMVGLALVAGLAGTTWQARVAGREKDLAKRRFDEVRALAHAVVFDIHDAIANLPGSTKARSTLVHHALGYLENLERESKGDLSLQRELALTYAKIGDVQGRPMFPNLGQSAEAQKSYMKALGLLAGVAQAQPESSSVVHDEIVVTQRLTDLLRVMGRPGEAMKRALESRDRILAQLAKRPNDRVFLADLCIASNRLTDMKLAAADTAGAVAECRTNLDLAEWFFRDDPKNPEHRRGALIAGSKMAALQASSGHRDSALASYQRAERLAIEAVAALPQNTDASRDLSIVYGMHGLFLADGGDLDSALAVYGHGMKLAEDLAAADPDNTLQQSDVAAGHYEIGTMLLQGHRARAAEGRFREAFERYRRIAAADSGSAESRAYMARICRQAGEASREVSRGAHSDAERAQWRARALTWLEKSRELYSRLAATGALVGEETRAPAELNQLVATVRAGN